jgi:hypothetical protein
MIIVRLRCALALFAFVLAVVTGITVTVFISAKHAIEIADAASASPDNLEAGGKNARQHRNR